MRAGRPARRGQRPWQWARACRRVGGRAVRGRVASWLGCCRRRRGCADGRFAAADSGAASDSYSDIGILQSSFRLAAPRPPADSGRARHRAADRKLHWTEPLAPALGYGRCMVGRHCWRAGRGSYGDVADRRRSVRMRAEALPQPSGGDGDACPPARCSGINGMRRLADLDGLITRSPGWPDTPWRRRGDRRCACSRRGTGDTAATSDRSPLHSGPDSQL